MKKMIIKLTAASLSLILAVTVAVMSSYAWLTLSDNPAANGIYIAVGGGNTILVAPDVVGKWDGVPYHYPGAFSDTLNFNQSGSYDYLSELAGLTPVSTTDGVHWILPDYYQKDDSAVIAGEAKNGDIKPVSEFLVDNGLSYANLTKDQSSMIDRGSYIYLDFWVVSPGADYRLRISTGDADANGGSFVIGLMEPKEADSDGDGQLDSYTLQPVNDSAAASARIGFLVNEDILTDNSMLAYMISPGYSDQFDKIKGVYPADYTTTTRFCIYEPNGTLHPGTSSVEDGAYAITQPLAYLNNTIIPSDVSGNLTVQDTGAWKQAQSGEGTTIEQIFQGTVVTNTFRSSTLTDLSSSFYTDYLQGQVGSYVRKGSFFKNSAYLYSLTAAGGATAEAIAQERENESSAVLAGATDDVYIVDLDRNVPQRIRMFIWLEGQDADCVNAATASSIAVSIELAGSNNGV